MHVCFAQHRDLFALHKHIQSHTAQLRALSVPCPSSLCDDFLRLKHTSRSVQILSIVSHHLGHRNSIASGKRLRIGMRVSARTAKMRQIV